MPITNPRSNTPQSFVGILSRSASSAVRAPSSGMAACVSQVTPDVAPCRGRQKIPIQKNKEHEKVTPYRLRVSRRSRIPLASRAHPVSTHIGAGIAPLTRTVGSSRNISLETLQINSALLTQFVMFSCRKHCLVLVS